MQAIELLMVYVLRYQVQVAEAKWLMAREDRKVAQLQGSRRGGGVDAQMLLEMHECDPADSHVGHSVADASHRESRPNSKGVTRQTQTSVRNKESIVVVNHGVGIEDATSPSNRHSRASVRSSEVGHNSGTGSANSSVRKIGTIEPPSGVASGSGSHGRTSNATPDRSSVATGGGGDMSKRTSGNTPTTPPNAPPPIVDPFKSRRAPARPVSVSVSVNDAPNNVIYKTPQTSRQSTPAELSQMTHLPPRGSAAVVSSGLRGRASPAIGTPESHSMTSSVVTSPSGHLYQQQQQHNQSASHSKRFEKPESTLPRSEYSTLQLSACAVSAVADSRTESSVVMQCPVDHMPIETKTIEPPATYSTMSKTGIKESTVHNHSSEE